MHKKGLYCGNGLNIKKIKMHINAAVIFVQEVLIFR